MWVAAQFLAVLFVAQFLHADLMCINSALCNPLSPEMTHLAPDKFYVEFVTSKGTFVVLSIRDWAPIGADRFYNLVINGFFDETRFYRVIKDFVVQFGVNGDPRIMDVYNYLNNVPGAILPDDPVIQSNLRRFLSYSASYNADHSAATNRTTELFINLVDNVYLDNLGFSPFGHVVYGMHVVDKLYQGYGRMAGECATCNGVNETLLYRRGNEYLKKDFPLLDYTLTARVFNTEQEYIHNILRLVTGVAVAAVIVVALAAALLVRKGIVTDPRNSRSGRGRPTRLAEMQALS